MSHKIKKIINFLVNPLLIGTVFTIYLSIITKSEFPLYIITFIYLVWLWANKKIISRVHWYLLAVLFLPLTPKVLYFLFLSPRLINSNKFNRLVDDRFIKMIRSLYSGIIFVSIHLVLVIWLSRYLSMETVKILFIILGFIFGAVFIRFLFQFSFSMCYVAILDKTSFYSELTKMLKLSKSAILVLHILAILIAIFAFIFIFALIYYFWFTLFYNFDGSMFDLIYFTFCIYYSIPISSDILMPLLTIINNDSVLRVFQIIHILTGKIVDLTILGFIIISLIEKLKELVENDEESNKN